MALVLFKVLPVKVAENGVETHGLSHLDALSPIFLRHALGVDLPPDDVVGLAVESERF